jgi:hypothetical protein
MIKYPKLYIGPMSKNIVDCISQFDGVVGLIPSRRQIEFDGGYVNNWTTDEFSKYVKSSNSNILIQRDHAGPSQGKSPDDGLKSLEQDILARFDLLHIDPWKKHTNIQDGINKTVDLINYCLSINSDCKFEIGTEQAIREFSVDELDLVFGAVEKQLGSKFENVVYGVIQGGTSIVGNKNTGVFEETRFKQMINVCKKYNILSKEHNGDYLTTDEVKKRFNLGLDSINIAPEFGFIETRTILEEIYNNQQEELFEEFFDLCYQSGKWKKWVSENFYLTSFSKHVIIRIAGHYVFSNPKMQKILNSLPDIQNKINFNLKNRVEQVLCSIK